MYTQCPDCSTAFRVTADVLKQAAGKVRCGGCGNAFNALAYLTETMPEQSAPEEADAALPELQPDTPKDDGLPASISAEQSAALLKTLDELAGSDIRIEDTGVEWRVLDDDEIGDAAADEPQDEEPRAEEPLADLVIDEVLDESPTPVDQFLTETPAIVDSPEIFEEPASEFTRTSVDEIRFDDNTPLPDDFDLDDDGFIEGDFVAEAPPVEEDVEEIEDVVEEDPQVDLDLSEPGEWTDILDEFEELAGAVSAPLEDELAALESEEEDELTEAAEPEEEEEDSAEEPLDMDAQFALQAEAMGIDLSGMREALEAEEEIPLARTADLDALLNESNDGELELEDLLDEELVEETAIGEIEPELESDEVTQLDLIDEDDDVVEDEELEEPVEIDEAEASDEPEEEPDLQDEHYVPPLTEEEQTINMQIDQDLLALAVEDEDGFASTIVIAEDAAEDAVNKDKKKSRKDKRSKKDKAERALKDTSAGFETIIMEGEDFRSTEDIDKLEADTAAAAVLAGSAAAEREAERAGKTSSVRYGIFGGIALLVLLLAAQYVHQSRETLATIPAFNNAVGPLYRAIGQPLSPEWDITGWRFEVAKGTEDEDEGLTIFSRLGNKSDKPLPYPLIGISLTDRFEETIGSRVLDPADYLPDDLDPRKLVKPGNTFEAVITIQSPAEATAGFRLRACYRTTDGLLRCKNDGFK